MTGKHMSKPSVRIGGASGYWGESDMALPQFLREGDLDYIVFDYLAEITMSIMARARSVDESLGYATDFVQAVMAPHLAQIAQQGVKILSNAGGVNPLACAQALRDIIDSQGLELKVAVVLGDDLIHQKDELAALGVTEMFSREPFPSVEKIASINAYLGAFPIAEALSQGADIVITGRCVDSAVTLGACIHEFGWTVSDLDCLAGASLAGHLIECGPQATVVISPIGMPLLTHWLTWAIPLLPYLPMALAISVSPKIRVDWCPWALFASNYCMNSVTPVLIICPM